MYYAVKTSTRKMRRDLNSALGDDILRYIIELVTNADDSYKRLGELAPTVKPIYVELSEKRGKYVVSVTDNAEGMTRERLIDVFATYGNDNAGGVKSGSRGIFGQGASDVLQAAANQHLPAMIETIKNDVPSKLLYKFDVDTGEKGIDVADNLSISKNKMAEYRKSLGIPGNGTKITFGVPENVKMNDRVINKLPESMEKNPYLRYVLSQDDTRVVFINGNKKTILSSKKYMFDKANLISDDEFDFNFDGKKIQCQLRTYRNDDKKDNRTQIIVKDERNVVYDNTMFDFRNTAAAQNISGELIIKDLYKLCYDHLNQEYPDAIVEDNRTGFDQKNPFYIELNKNVNNYLSRVIADNEDAAKTINLNNHKKLNDALKKLNQYIKSELKDSISDESGNAAGKNPPMEGLKFARNSITVTKDKQYDLKLYINSALVGCNEEIKISCDSDAIEFSPETITYGEDDVENGIAVKNVVIKGIELTDDAAIIEARTSTRTATATIDVIEEDIHYPENGFEFYPKDMVFAGTGKHTAKLYIDSEIVPVDSYIHIDCDGLEHQDDIIFCSADLINETIGVVNVALSGGKIEETYPLIATTSEKKAEASVLLVEESKNEPQNGGLISGIDIEANEEGQFQAYYQPYTHKIVINSSNPINRIAMDPIDSIDGNNPVFGKKIAKYLCDLVATQAAILLVKQKQVKNGEINVENFDDAIDQYENLIQIQKNKIYPEFYNILRDESKE